MMEPIVLDKNFESVLVLDTYESLIWTERYSKAGDFELYLFVTAELLDAIQIGRYLYLEESEKVMVIEGIEVQTDPLKGNKLHVTGRSLEFLLGRRIVWQQTVLNGYLQGQIKKLINQNIISPSLTDRRITNFVFRDTTDTSITGASIRAQYTGDNLYDVITTICDEFGFGFKITLENDQFIFSLYNGLDRTYDQVINDRVIFSPEFDNLLNTNFIYNTLDYRTIALVAGEDEGLERQTTTISFYDDPVELQGLGRRELYVDARDLQQDEDLTSEEYIEALQQRGLEKLLDHMETMAFDGSLATNISFTYGDDYYIGDVVQFENEYGISAKCRVTEFIRSMNSKGYSEYPTFEMV